MKSNKKVICIIQARMSSSRLPGKSLIKINRVPCIEIIINRVRKSIYIDDLWLACTSEESDDILVKYVKKMQVNIFRGSLNDVLSRYVEIAKKESADYVVRITGDCPLIDHNVIDEIIKKIKNNNYDYVSNTIERTYPDGIDAEVFKKEALIEADINSTSPFMREHVTPYISGKLKKYLPSGEFKIGQIKNFEDLSKFRLTLDREEDLKLLNNIFKKLGNNCNWKDAVNLITKDSKLFQINQHIVYNENTLKSLKKYLKDE